MSRQDFIRSIEKYEPFNEQEKMDKQLILEWIKNHDNAFSRENAVAHMTASAWVVNRDRSKVLMVYHNIYNSWSWLGGHADEETDLLSVAIREVKEEAGICDVHPVSEEIFSIECLTVDGHVKKGNYVSGHLHLNVTYLLEADSEEAVSIKADENSGVAWFLPEEALKKSTEPWFVEHIYSKLIDKVKLTGQGTVPYPVMSVITLGAMMIHQSKERRQYFLYGLMAVVLGCGDAFHLVPRAIALCTTGLEHYTVSLGIGKMITSVTMTVFYVLLYYVWRVRYQVEDKKGLTLTVWGLSLLRIVLCLMPQNAWTSAQAPFSWGIYRNIPFTILGLVIVILFYRSAKAKQDKPFRFLWIAVVISFACYIPVVLFADMVPMVGMLMIPKTCAYVWVVLIGYKAMKGSN